MDIEVKQSHINWEALSTSTTAYALRDAFDVEVFTYIYAQVDSGNTFGTGASPRTLGYGASMDSPLVVLNRHMRLLNEANVPFENRWLAGPPIFWELLQDENSKLIGVDFSSTLGDSSVLKNGMIAPQTIRGFRCYMTNNMPTDATLATNNVVLSGHMSAVCTATNLIKMETIRDQNSFADMVRGLHVYGRKALRTTALCSTAYTVG